MTPLERAKDLQQKVASETACWVRLDLLEALIAEIERLEAERPLKVVRDAAKAREAS